MSLSIIFGCKFNLINYLLKIALRIKYTEIDIIENQKILLNYLIYVNVSMFFIWLIFINLLFHRLNSLKVCLIEWGSIFIESYTSYMAGSSFKCECEIQLTQFNHIVILSLPYSFK